jgi:hypothetical protein
VILALIKRGRFFPDTKGVVELLPSYSEATWPCLKIFSVGKPLTPNFSQVAFSTVQSTCFQRKEKLMGEVVFKNDFNQSNRWVIRLQFRGRPLVFWRQFLAMTAPKNVGKLNHF